MSHPHESNCALDRFYAQWPGPPEGFEDMEDEFLALSFSNYWDWYDEHVAPTLPDSIPAPLRDFCFHLELLGDQRIQQLAEMPYREYLRTREWQARRTVMRSLANERCQLCNSPDGLNVHHRTYDRRGYERWSDLIVLCSSCHTLFHKNRKLAE